MKTIPESVKTLFNEQKAWFIGTFSDTANVVPVAFKQITDDGHIVLADVFMVMTRANVEANGQIAVTACDGGSMQGYSIKGTAQYLSEGPIVEQFKTVVETATKGGLHARGAILITPEEIINISVSAKNNERL